MPGLIRIILIIWGEGDLQTAQRLIKTTDNNKACKLNFFELNYGGSAV
jgi:hypothetical protein